MGGGRAYGVCVSELVARLRDIVGEEACLSRPDELFVYECDALTLTPHRPEVVVLPRETEQVAAVVRACREFGAPFV